MECVRETLSALPKDSAAKMEAGAALLAFATEPGGLKEDEARRRLEGFGPNELRVKRITARDVLFRQFRSPMTYMLGAASAISLALGEWIDGLTVLVILLINTWIGFYQEYRSEKAIEKLRERLAPRTRVRRGGRIIVVDRRSLVPGDIVLFSPGDIVPADIRVTLARRLTLDESALTGESIVVTKTSDIDGVGASGRAKNMAYLMTRVVAGTGEGVVAATGAATVIGRIARLTEETPRVSAFEKNIQSFSGFLLKTVLIILAVVFAINVGLKGRSQILPQFLFAVALAVSVVPEALPAITSVTLSNGALKLAKHHVVVKRLAAIEDLGHVEVLCADKTGTLTEGIMTVDAVSADDRRRCLLWAMATSEEEDIKNPPRTSKTFGAALAADLGPEGLKEVARWKRSWFTPFDPSRSRATAVFDDGKGPMLAVFGAPEVVLSRSTSRQAKGEAVALRPAEAAAESEAFKKEGLAGRRVLALAFKRIGEKAVYDDEDERELTYVGRVAFVDPLKPTAKKAVADAKSLRVAFKIITGDSLQVAAAVGIETGIIARFEEVIGGDALDAIPDAEFHRVVAERGVFARVTPEQKFRIIQALEREFQVGFLGEGINDAPALKAANVALAVENASDVARESADIILLKKDLRVIIDGIRDGRAVFTNIIKYIKFTLIGNFGNFLSIAAVSLIIDDLPMLPAQILLTNLLTDLPMVSVAGDSIDAAEVAVPKHFNLRELAFFAMFLGLVSSFFDFTFFALNRGEGLDAMRTLWFLFSVVTELALVFSIRSRGPFWKASRPSRTLVGFCVLTVATAAATTLLPFGHEIFRFVQPDGRQLANMLWLVIAYFSVTEIVKLAYGKVFKPVPDAV